MIRKTLLAVFATVTLLSASMAGAIILYHPSDAAAMKSKGTYNDLFGPATKRKICGDRLCSEQPKSSTPTKEQTQSGTPTQPQPKPQPYAPAPTMEPKMEWKTVSGTVKSAKDPGIGHEKHQLAVLLPPSDKVYVGTVTFDASEPIQLVSLQGPLGAGDEGGQPIWTPDGKTKFGLTFIDNGDSAGSWNFVGNALAVHTMKETPFTVSYSLHYMESSATDTIKSGTLHSVQDPGIGHETHQLAIVLPPRDTPYSGTVSFEASEPVQLVALHGPLKEGQDMGQPIWTPDGKTKFALTFVDKGQASGVWSFVGNAIAFHTKNTTPFTVTYSVDAQ